MPGSVLDPGISKLNKAQNLPSRSCVVICRKKRKVFYSNVSPEKASHIKGTSRIHKLSELEETTEGFTGEMPIVD